MKQDTSWHKVSNWYKKVPKAKTSNHQELIIPGLKRIMSKYLFPGAAVMDMACGEGSVTAALKVAGYQTTGFDLAPGLIASAKAQSPEINFFVADSQSLDQNILKEHVGKYDAVTCVLALQNIKDLNRAIATASKLTGERGYFIFVLNHPAFRIPKASAWEFESKEKQYRRIDKYMSAMEIPITAHPGEKQSEVTWSFHRPLQTYFQALLQNKFSVIDLEEWVSAKQSERGPRAKAEDEARKEFPLFMTIIAKKIN